MKYVGYVKYGYGMSLRAHARTSKDPSNKGRRTNSRPPSRGKVGSGLYVVQSPRGSRYSTIVELPTTIYQ